MIKKQSNLGTTISHLHGLCNGSIIKKLVEINRTEPKLFQLIKKYKYQSNDFPVIDFEWIEKQK